MLTRWQMVCVEIKHAFGAHRGDCPVVMEQQPAGSAVVGGESGGACAG